MLDKTVEFHPIIMARPFSPAPPLPPLPEGFVLRAYQPGDAAAWARIETEVGEFDSEADALCCYAHYLPNEDALRKRQFFVLAPDGTPAATATAWTTERGESSIPTVHALACRPKYQGLGLGRAAAIGMLQAFYALDKGKDVWLDTQTWSWRAVGLYLSLGFYPLKTAVYNGTPNEYAQALPLLKARMRPELFERFTRLAR